MMGTYIKGMKTPKACGLCPFRYINMSGYLICEMLHKQINLSKFNERFKDCPLVEVKEPHGRLGDLDKLMTEFIDSDLDHLQRDDWREVIQIVSDAETVIEVEGETDA